MPPPSTPEHEPSNKSTSTTTRSKTALLNAGTKQPLRKPSSSTLNLSPGRNPSAFAPSVAFQSSSSSSSTSPESTLVKQTLPIEVDIVGRAGQPFLDPVRWEEVRRVAEMRRGDGDGGEEGERDSRKGRKEVQEEERRKRQREAEFGGMAVRGRIKGPR